MIPLVLFFLSLLSFFLFSRLQIGSGEKFSSCQTEFPVHPSMCRLSSSWRHQNRGKGGTSLGLGSKALAKYWARSKKAVGFRLDKPDFLKQLVVSSSLKIPAFIKKKLSSCLMQARWQFSQARALSTSTLGGGINLIPFKPGLSKRQIRESSPPPPPPR